MTFNETRCWIKLEAIQIYSEEYIYIPTSIYLSIADPLISTLSNL